MITKRTKIMLVVLVLVALGAYAYLYWWSKTPDHGVFDTIPVVRDASDKASNAVVRPQPATPGAPAPTAPAASATYRTYENTEVGFSFSHPDNWIPNQTSVDPRTTICMNVAEGTGDCLASVAFEEESVNMNEGIAREALETELRAGQARDTERRIAGSLATVYTVSGYPAGEEKSTRAAVFTHADMVYIIKASKGQEAVFDRIVSSFEFQD